MKNKATKFSSTSSRSSPSLVTAALITFTSTDNAFVEKATAVMRWRMWQWMNRQAREKNKKLNPAVPPSLYSPYQCLSMTLSAYAFSNEATATAQDKK